MICLYPSSTPLEDKVCQEIGKLLVDRPLLCTSPRHHTAKWAVDVTGRKEIIVKMKKKIENHNLHISLIFRIV